MTCIPGKSAGDGDTAGDVDGSSSSAMIQPAKPRPLLETVRFRSQTAFCSEGTRLSRGHGDKITQTIINHQSTHDTKISKSDSVNYFSSSSAASAARRPGAPITPPPEWIVEYITFYTPHF